MKAKIESILATELERLKQLSDNSGLELADFRKLEALVKIHRDFLGGPNQTDTNQNDPALASLDDLLAGVSVVLPDPV